MNDLIHGLNADTKLIFINQYKLFAGLPKTYGSIKTGKIICITYIVLINVHNIGFYKDIMIKDLTLEDVQDLTKVIQ